MHNFRFLLVLVLLLTSRLSLAATTQVFLLQNSGWMEPFFTDSKSQLKPLCKALVQSAGAFSEEIVIASFNQAGAISGEKSPQVIYRGKPVMMEIQRAVQTINLPKRRDGKYADADFQGALNGTLLDILNRQPAIIWMVTNNKNDPNNSPDVKKHTQGFYQLLREHPGITRVAAMPVTMPCQGNDFREGGLMIYALSFGESSNKELEQITGSEAMKKMFPKPFIRLKPLTKQPVAFVPASVATPGIKARLQKGRLVLSGLESLKNGGTVTIAGALESNYYPQEIGYAALAIDWARFGGNSVPNIANRIQPPFVRGLLPKGRIDGVQVDIQISPLPSIWSPDSLFSNGYEINGILRISLSELSMSLSPLFKRQMDNIFGLDQLPGIFYPDKHINSAQTLIPVQMVVRYPVWPLVVVLITALLLLIASVAAIILLNREKRYALLVDGAMINVAVRPLKTKGVFGPDGNKVAEIRGALFGKPEIKSLQEGKVVTLR